MRRPNGMDLNELAEWIVEYSDRDENGCLISRYHLNHWNYPKVRYRGKMEYCGRVVMGAELQLEPRDWDKGIVIRHQCHNPACVNPDHMLTGTQKENIQDSLRDGRPVGSKPYLFTDDAVRFARNNPNISNMYLQELTGIDRRRWGEVRNGKRRKRVV